MRIALIFCPFSHRKFEEDLECVSNHFGVYPPLGLAYAASILEKAGHDVIIIDANALKLSKKETLNKIKAFKPQLLGFMLTTYMFRLTLEWIKYFKKDTGLPIVVGNLNVQLYPRETLSHNEIDYGIIGPAHESLPKLISAIENKTDISQIEGICYKNDGKIIIKLPESFKENFDNLPFPARHLLPNEKYFQFISKKKNFTIMITTKGCPSPCNFCFVNQVPYQERSVENVLEEIQECYNRYSIREIDFFEPSFTTNRNRVIKICDEIIKMNFDINWSCRARVDQVDEELLKKMKAAGCSRIYYGLESGDQSILKKINKNIALERIIETIKLTKKVGIKSMGFFMIGQPGDTKETALKTIKFAKSLPLDYVQFCRTIPKPCSYLDKKMQEATGRDYWRDFVLGKIDVQRLPTPWTNLTEKDKIKLTNKAYKEFYFRPKYIIKNIISIKSWHEFSRYLKASFEIISNKGNISVEK